MTHRRYLPIAALLILGLHPLPAAAQVALPTHFENEEVAGGFDLPNGMAFLPDGRVLVTEQKTAHIRMIVNGHVAATDPVVTVAGVNTDGYERGLQGIAVDPGWPTRPFVYVYYSRIGGKCAVARYRASGDLDDPLGENLALGERQVILGDIPDDDPNHQAGCLRFAADGTLFVSIGEDEDFCAAFDSTSLKGQLLRLDVTRMPATSGFSVPYAMITPSGNPLSSPDSNAQLVWAYGMRNPWRFHVDTTGLVYLADVGEQHFEEYNEVEAGDYLGWPYREGNRIMPRDACPEPDGEGTVAYKAPIAVLEHPEQLFAIISAGVYRPRSGGHNWPAAYWGDAFYGEYYTGVLRRIENVGGTWQPAVAVSGQPSASDWATGLVSAVDFLVGPDGALWWLRQFNDAGDETSGSLNRIHYTGPDTIASTRVELVRVLATPGVVRIEWYVSDTGATADVQRRDPGGAWATLGRVEADGSGLLIFEDTGALPGRRYLYRLELDAGGFSAEFAIDVPDRLALAVHGLRMTPGGAPLIAFSTPERGRVRLELFDVNGRRVVDRDLGDLEAGEQLVRLDGMGIASGIYLARIRQGANRASGKAILTR